MLNVQQTLFKDTVLQTYLSRHGNRYRSFWEMPQNQLVGVFVAKQRQVRVSSGPVVKIATRGLSRTAHSILSFCVQKADRTLWLSRQVVVNENTRQGSLCHDRLRHPFRFASVKELRERWDDQTVLATRWFDAHHVLVTSVLEGIDG